MSREHPLTTERCKALIELLQLNGEMSVREIVAATCWSETVTRKLMARLRQNELVKGANRWVNSNWTIRYSVYAGVTPDDYGQERSWRDFARAAASCATNWKPVRINPAPVMV